MTGPHEVHVAGKKHITNTPALFFSSPPLSQSHHILLQLYKFYY